MNYEYTKWGNILQKEDWSLPRKMVVFVWVALEKQNITLLSTSVFKKSFVFCFKIFLKKIIPALKIHTYFLKSK